MTNKEAIKWLGLEVEIWEAECKSAHPTKEALKMAIEALEKMNQRCENCKHRRSIDFEMYWCSISETEVYSDMWCTDWSDEEC